MTTEKVKKQNTINSTMICVSGDRNKIEPMSTEEIFTQEIRDLITSRVNELIYERINKGESVPINITIYQDNMRHCPESETSQ